MNADVKFRKRAWNLVFLVVPLHNLWQDDNPNAYIPCLYIRMKLDRNVNQDLPDMVYWHMYVCVNLWLPEWALSYSLGRLEKSRRRWGRRGRLKKWDGGDGRVVLEPNKKCSTFTMSLQQNLNLLHLRNKDPNKHENYTGMHSFILYAFKSLPIARHLS